MLGTFNPITGAYLYNQKQQYTSLQSAIISLYLYPNTAPLGEYFWLKTRLPYWWSSADSLELHYLIAEAHPDIVDSYRNDGFCITVYGATLPILMEKIPNADIYIYNDPPIDLIEVSSTLMWNFIRVYICTWHFI